jgi:hypothetical protein
MKMELLFLLGAATCVTTASAAGSCTPQTTRGDWVYTCEGLLPAPALTPTRILGTCTASKTGYFNCSGTVNLGGQIIPQTLMGQANNQANCTGDISYVQTLGGAPAGTLEINYVVSRGGDAISGLPTNSNGVLSCSLRRIGKGSD